MRPAKIVTLAAVMALASSACSAARQPTSAPASQPAAAAGHAAGNAEAAPARQEANAAAEATRANGLARPATFTDADYAAHIVRLRQKIPAWERFTVVVEPPFVVIGDEPPDQVRRRAVQTVRWAAGGLKNEYFSKDPDEILDIWLFKDDASYRRHARSIFGHNPSTPFGYYSDSAKALIMNVATGGGTLVHEIVHPFIASNFPNCPAWLNEGLGSLYEQSGQRDGRIVGYTNWRLAGLQKAVRTGRVPSFKTLASMSSHQFYDEDSGTNYAQARYLCYYLQEHGLLKKFYKDFHANQVADPTGYQTLKAVLGEDDMAAFKAKWEAYVLKLRFP